VNQTVFVDLSFENVGIPMECEVLFSEVSLEGYGGLWMRRV
jgi:hypothetical protein